MRNNMLSDNKIKDEVYKSVSSLLPDNWIIKYAPAPKFIDAVIELSAPDGIKKAIVVEIKNQLDPKNVDFAISKAKQQNISDSILIAAPYLGERTREKLANAGANYIDLTGNVLIKIDQPAIYIDKQGADKNPWRTKRPARTLKGIKAAKIVRTLCDFKPPLGVRELATLAQTDPGYVSRILEMLDREDLINRNEKGAVSSVDWASLLHAWSNDYSLLKYNSPFSYLDPRGIDNFLNNIKGQTASGLSFNYAITGSLSASRVAPFAPARMAICFVDNNEKAALALKLIPADAGANVLLVEPKADFVFLRSRLENGINYTALSQTVVDLLTGPGRNPAEAEALIEWMKENEDAWRT